ncbi:MAG: proton-conducting transporter membrane subunit [Pseudomonadota bacterium]
MILFMGAVLVLLIGACLLPFAGSSPRANTAGPAFAVTGSIMSLAAGLGAIQGGGWELEVPWPLLAGSVHLKMDPLSAWFSVVVSLVSVPAAVYGSRYMSRWAGEKHLGMFWSFFLVLIASMLGVTVAWNGVLFLVFWEIMSVSSFFLVIFESERPGVLKAGWIYLTATHLGTACLFIMFAIMGQGGSFDFGVDPVSGSSALAVFILGFIGFGSKAGFMPFHVWLPEAHPAAPSHVSALMSAAMIKTGIYGIVRICVLLGPARSLWGWTFIVAGVMTGLGGILFALVQKDLKKLLAYSSVENVGIITIGLGLGFLSFSTGSPVIGILGFSGAILHVLNHAVFKSLVFLCAGSVLHGAGTLNMEQTGGLMKTMPITGTTFVIGAAAICALPPLNGFSSEFLIYLGSFSSLYGSKGTVSVMAGVIIVSALALIGGLAVVCFSKAAGTVFLGEPRSARAAQARESSLPMAIPMAALAGLCGVIGILAPQVLAFLSPVLDTMTQGSPFVSQTLDSAVASLCMVSRISLAVMTVVVVLMALRHRLLAKRKPRQGCTWDCGYEAPTSRMQYTGSSFSDPVVGKFRSFLGAEKDMEISQDLFPAGYSMKVNSKDSLMHWIYVPLFSGIEWASLKLHWLQRGYNQLYILYIVITLLVLLFLVL